MINIIINYFNLEISVGQKQKTETVSPQCSMCVLLTCKVLTSNVVCFGRNKKKSEIYVMIEHES